MVVHLTEDDVRSLATMELALDAVEAAFRALGKGEAENVPRRRLAPSVAGRPPRATLQLMAASFPEANVMGYKAYATSPGGTRFLVMLHQADTGELLAVLEADWLGRYRTGAASGVASKYLARRDARTLGLYGTGGQALTQLLAVSTVLPGLERVRVFSRAAARRAGYAARFAELAPQASQARFAIEPVETPQQAAEGADVVIMITNAREPVLQGEWLAPGVHINAAGINRAGAAEIDARVVQRATLVTVDALDQARNEAGDLLAAEREGAFTWSRAVELGAVVAGGAPGRSSAGDITLFESQGLAIEDVAFAAALYRLATERSAGRRLPLWESF